MNNTTVVNRNTPSKLCLTVLKLGIILSAVPVLGRMAPNQDQITGPAGGATASRPYAIVAHNIGRIALAVNNNGTFGDGFAFGGTRDYFTGEDVPSCEYPKESRTKYVFAGALWVGAIVDGDTLVSVGADGWSFVREFHPDQIPMNYRSTIDPAREEYEGAVSEQDYIAVYYDNCTDCSGIGMDVLDNRPHRPINLEVTQRTYAWSYSYAQDFVLFDYALRNIGSRRLRRVYMGIYVDADIYSLLEGNGGAQDDLCGFRQKSPALYLKPPCPPDSDIVNIAWTVDNNGDFDEPGKEPVANITATRIVRTPSDSLEVSFNWWISNGNPALDFGPHGRYTFRDYTTGGLGTPEGDRNKYHILSNGEFDYDQPRCAQIGPLDSVWLPPPADRAGIWATGLDTRYVLSFGPFAIEPGQTLPISLAYVGGLDFHTLPSNFGNLPDNPDRWYENVNFDSLGTNATWADWIYDNPGVDTDSDGYYGEFTVCNLGGDSTLKCDSVIDTTAEPDTPIVTCYWDYDNPDTVWRKGDGVPDFRGASPPPSPATYSIRQPDGTFKRGLRVDASTRRVRLIWNGVLSENTPDVFSREYDFEGYRVWLARDQQASSYSLAASYDIEDYNRWEFNHGTGDYQLNVSPFTLQQLKCLYAPDSCADEFWHPLQFTRRNPLVLPGQGPGGLDAIYYFTPQDFNRSVLGNFPNADTEIRKIYPNAPKPPILDVDSIRVMYPPPEDTLYLTDDGFIKYYEYEYTFDELLPTVPYWFNVTTFDYGSPQSGLAALETSPTIQPVVTYALETVENVTRQNLEAFVYPNPYRLDADYRAGGFEARANPDYPEDRTREIHFANLPPRCTIRVFSIDGDLVIELEHNVDPADPLANHATWNMITRNSQLIVSGLYYWTVEDPEGNSQIGKLVVLM